MQKLSSSIKIWTPSENFNWTSNRNPPIFILNIQWGMYGSSLKRPKKLQESHSNQIFMLQASFWAEMRRHATCLCTTDPSTPFLSAPQCSTTSWTRPARCSKCHLAILSKCLTIINQDWSCEHFIVHPHLQAILQQFCLVKCLTQEAPILHTQCK